MIQFVKELPTQPGQYRVFNAQTQKFDYRFLDRFDIDYLRCHKTLPEYHGDFTHWKFVLFPESRRR